MMPRMVATMAATRDVGRVVMRRIPVYLSVCAVVLLGIVGLTAQRSATAQEATPAMEGEMQGVTFEPVSFAFGVAVPSPADLVLARFTLQPGATLPLEENDPSGGMLLVESGEFTVRAEAELSVTRGAGLSAAMATAEASGNYGSMTETVAVGEEATLQANDAAYIPGSINGEIRNDGTEPAVGLVFILAPSEGMMATPEP
jgi:hypothetical protein